MSRRFKPIILGDKRQLRRSFRKNRWSRRLRNLLILIFVLSYGTWAMDLMGERTQVNQALVDITKIERASRMFRADLGRCPDTIDELKSPPTGEPYIREIVDPWGKPYQLRCPASYDPGGVEVISGGPDRTYTGQDNISSL